MLRTSLSDPIRVDLLPQGALAGPGRLGMTFAPGKRGAGVTACWERDLDADLARLKDVWQVGALVSLLEDHELPMLGIPDLYGRAEAHGLMVIRFPIRDVSVPGSVSDTAALVRRVLALVEAGETVCLHCRGGWGRTGLVAACTLVAAGHEPDAAVALVREVRPGTIETAEQERYVFRFAVAASDRHGQA